MTDTVLQSAIDQAQTAIANVATRPVVQSFFDEATFTASHVVHDPATRQAAIIDSVLDFDQASGTTTTLSAQAIVDYVAAERLTVAWILETHAHADHLSAAPWLQEKLGAKLAIGRDIVTVQDVFGKLFNEGTAFQRDGSQFDRLLADGDTLAIGDLVLTALHVPGHTPADMAYLIGDALFVGDTMFMPDYGTARVDFPGGSGRDLYRSIRRLLGLPDAVRVFLCHDYKAPNRDMFAWETTIGAERTGNVHIHEGVDEDAFVAMRTARDATLGMPKLILPSLQVNMRAGHLPEPEDNGKRYLKLPLNAFGSVENG
ncbi:MBL fold metallo-hydrolase [Sphingorhabdus soli]|uniref:MBL fold metallo-hydrolase n=1 Tax=Flavisphingopyxis soli TaxID=2601267 RepID=A0A5C6UMQ9_9SPHN|nr:MBL fold metallo-hydrolase [Sphingorhabdus soli]TXC73396.1 MBL fold metallo-hydrolase [Sphingorhabdus soli]